MRNALLITIIVVAALAAAIWYLSTRPGKQDLTTWQLVPSSSLAVLETEQPRILERLSADSAKLVNLLLAGDSINASPEPWLFSIHSLGNRTGIVALLKKTRTSTPLELAKNTSQATSKERNYQDIQITDVSLNNQPWLSIARTRGVWIVSHHGILVEEIIRTLKTENNPTFQKKNARLFQLSNVKQDDGNLYIRWSAFRDITSKNVTDPILQAANLCDAMLFDLRWTGNGSTLLLNGFAVDSLANKSILSIFKQQRPIAFGLKNRLPDQFQYFVHFGISNPVQWLKDRNNYTAANHPAILKSLQDLESKTSLRTSELFDAIDNEAALCTLPSGDHLLVIELKEITKADTELSRINIAAAKANQYSHERYADQDIHILQPSLLPTVFWPLSFEASEIYYTIADDLLVISDGETAIKKFVDSMSGESTLNKSLEWNKYLESTLQESNVSFFVSSADQLFGNLRQPQKFSMQFYALEGDYYASSIMQFGKTSDKKTTTRNVRRGLDFGQTLTSTPWTVRNHNDRSTEVLLIDGSNQLHLISKDQKVLWDLQLPGPVIDGIDQVDLLKNGKLQYVFVTAGQLHAVDRLGRYVSGYPKAVGMSDAVFTSIVDYDNSRNYRMLLANAAGKITVVDLEGKPLEGWQSKSLPRGFVDAPQHFRLRQRDYYLAVTVQGDMFLFNRRSDIIDGFPLALNINPSGDVVSDGRQFVLVSRDGTMVQVNTSGKKTLENALFKKSPNAFFQLVASRNDDGFVIVKTEQGFITAFDRNGKQIFEINNPASDNLQLSLHHFDNGDVLVVFDKDQSLFYACDLKGKMLIPQPLQATGLPTVALQSGNLVFYVPDQSRLTTVSGSF